MQPLEIKKNDWNPITQQKMLEYKVQNTKWVAYRHALKIYADILTTNDQVDHNYYILFYTSFLQSWHSYEFINELVETKFVLLMAIEV